MTDSKTWMTTHSPLSKTLHSQTLLILLLLQSLLIVIRKSSPSSMRYLPTKSMTLPSLTIPAHMAPMLLVSPLAVVAVRPTPPQD